MHNAINVFSDSVLNTPEAEQFFKARTAFEQDDLARDLMTRINTLSHELGTKQRQGTLEESEIKTFRSLQKEFSSNETVAALEQHENSFTELLQACNAAISEQIKMDFAAQAAPSQCGCG